MSDADTVLVDDEAVEGLPSEAGVKRRGRPAGTKNKPRAANATEQAEVIVVFAGLLRLSAFLAAMQLKYPVLLMSPNEANAIAKPLSRIFLRSALGKLYGKYVSGSGDYVALAYALYQYGERVWSQSEQLVNSYTGGKAASNGTGPTASNAGGTATGGPSGPDFAAGFINLTPGRE